MHDDTAEGSPLQVDPPENDFALVEASQCLLIAGGIGITPILSMDRRLSATGKPFQLIYCTGTADEAAYLDEVKAISGHWTDGRVHFEGYAGVDAVRPDNTPFTVKLAGSGPEIEVPPTGLSWRPGARLATRPSVPANAAPAGPANAA